MRYGKILPLLLMSSLLMATSMMAQVSTSTILGTVTDQSRANVPDVQVKITDVGTGFEWTTTTDANGNYIVENLKPGQYKIAANKAGFKEKTTTGITVLVGQRARFDIEMEVGEVTQQIEVQAATPVIETDSSTVGKVITTKDVLELPLNGRNFLQLAVLTPGVQPYEVSYMDYTGGAISANGMSAWSNVSMIDGIYNQEEGAARMSFSPSIDLIQEFKIQTNVYDAEFGQSGGAQINLLTKRGTSSWHGSAFEFVRNNALDARPFFQPGALPDFSRNQFGGTFGGHFTKKDYFFVSYEGLRSNQGLTSVMSVPTEAIKAGDFSGTGTTIYDPLTQDPVTGQRQPFPGNIIPANRFSPQVSFFNPYYPTPQTSAFSRNYVANPVQTDSTNEISFRYDRDFSEKDSLTFRYTRKKRYAELPLGSSGFNTPLPGFGEIGDFWGQNHKLGWTRIFSPGTVNTVNLGFSQYHQSRHNADAGTNFFEQAGISGVPPQDQESGFPELIISGWSGLNDNYVSGVDGPENNYIINDTLGMIKGKHSFRFGGGYQYMRCVEYFNAFTTGRVNFSPTYTTAAPNAAGNQFNSFADYLLGYPTSSSIFLNQFAMDFRESWWSAFVQDNWSVSPSLTLNLGLRYEIYNRPIDAGNRYRALDLNSLNWIYPVTVPVGQPGVPPNSKTNDELGYPRAIQQPTTYNNWGPRLGFAWRPLGDNKTVLRGGYALFWNWTVFDMPTLMGLGAAPWDPSSSITCNSTAPCVTHANPFNTTVVPSLGGASANNTNRTPYTQQYSLGIQRELTPTLGLDVAYVGNAGRKNWFQYNFNSPHAGPGSNSSRSPYPEYAGLSSIVTWGTSHYDSLQLSLRKTYSMGLMFLGSYTWSHAIGNSVSGPEFEETFPFRDPYNWKLDTGNTPYDIRHILSVSWVYELPWGRGKQLASDMSKTADLLIGGWKFGGIASFRTGNWLTPSDVVNVSNAGGSRPDAISNPNISHSNRSDMINEWFDTGAFVRAPLYTFGNAGTGIIEGPGYENFDLSLYKVFAVAENKHLTFRAEFFNAFNRPNFGNPNTSFGTAGFGQITSSLSGRDIQFGFRFDF
jgi:hypothetical protein